MSNSLPLARASETIEIKLDEINIISGHEALSNLIIKDNNGNVIPIQFIDDNQDSKFDYFIFQTNFEPNETKEFKISFNKNSTAVDYSKSALRTFCRLVPERMDDFAWENDKVAFRTYGPECQRLFENEDTGGLISSGIDCWTKRVDYPIINKWYRNAKHGKSYHKDYGEGYDGYHVGTTRGNGGVALLHEGKAILSKNFISSKVLANGPIRSVFELEYAPVLIDSIEVFETKKISIDLGSNFYHCNVSYTSEKRLNTLAIGLAFHNGEGEVALNKSEGWISYWEPYGDSYLGTGVLIQSENFIKTVLETEIKNNESLNNIWIHSKIEAQSVNYWSGFGWQKAGSFNSAEAWNTHLSKTSQLKSNPIKVSIN